MIQLRNVYKKYKDTYALQNINLDIMSSEFVFLTGSSGAGKSTLMKLLYREEIPTSGTVMIGNINIAKIPNDRVPNIRRCMGKNKFIIRKIINIAFAFLKQAFSFFHFIKQNQTFNIFNCWIIRNFWHINYFIC